MVFTTLALLQLGNALAVRSETESLFHLGLRSNRALTVAIGAILVVQLALIYVPVLQPIFVTEALSPLQLGIVLVAASAGFVAVELEKLVQRRRARRGRGRPPDTINEVKAALGSRHAVDRRERQTFPKSRRARPSRTGGAGSRIVVRWLTRDPTMSRSRCPQASRGGARRHLGLAVALTLVGAVVVVGAIQAVGLLTTRGAGAASSGGPAASSGAAVAPGSSAQVASPVASAPPAQSPEASEAPRSPVPPTSPGLIAVVDDNGALSTMDDGGGSRVDYPAPGIVFGFPAWSPDGSRIAVVGEGPNDSAIYVYTVPRGDAGSPAAGGKPVVIYRSADRPPFYLYWTPDGRAVAFLATEATEIALRIAPADGSAPLDGSGPAAIIRQGAPLYYDWVDAKRLLLHVGVGSEAFVGEVGLDGKAIQPALPGTGVFRSASVSRDGRYLAYVRSNTDGSGQLVVAPRKGTASHEVPVFGIAAFDFDPTGDTLASIAADKPVDPTVGVPVGPLRLIDPATGAVRTLLDGSVVAFFWSPDGKTIAALSLAQPGDDQVTAGTGVVLAGAVAPGPSAGGVAQAAGIAVRLAFVDVSTGTVRSERVVRLAEHFVNQLLPYFDQYALSHRLWSPDSASLLLPLVDATGAEPGGCGAGGWGGSPADHWRRQGLLEPVTPRVSGAASQPFLAIS